MRQALEASKNKEVDCYNLQHFLDQKNNVIRPNTNFRMLTFSTFEHEVLIILCLISDLRSSMSYYKLKSKTAFEINDVIPIIHMN